MNNEDINPKYKGRFLSHIVDLEPLKFYKGTVLIQETGMIEVYFQLRFDYTYYNEWPEERVIFSKPKNSPMEILPGSAIDRLGRHMTDSQKFCLAQHVRVPTDDELEWYESLNVV